MDTILDDYFRLSDLAGHDGESMKRLLALFSENAVVIPNNSNEIKGMKSIAHFFADFFKRNAEMHHVWSTVRTENGLETKWAVCAKKESGEVFALSGQDIARLDTAGKIQSLKVVVA